ncbi:MAG: pilus assembly protein N-terminal domain-containing protein [Mesorhizobium sp.]
MALGGGASAALSADIDVVMNEAKVVKLSREADTVIIGNPEIADASVQDANTLVLTAKGFGITNLVVLDRQGNPIVDEQIVVSRQAAQSIRIYRRANVQTMSCTPYCEGAFRSGAEQASDAQVSGP